MEYRIEHTNNIVGFENVRFAVDLVKLTKAAKNRSYPNLSNCCGAKLKQIKECSQCGKVIEDPRECKYKEFKLGKESVKVSADHLNAIKEQLDSDRIVITEFRDMFEIPDMFYTDVIFGVKQGKKFKKEYAEYADILNRAGKVAVGTINYRQRPYPVMIYPYQGKLIMRALHFFEEVDPLPAVEPVTTNEQKVNLLSQAMQLTTKNNQEFDIGKFENTRARQEEELIERILKGEELPEAEKIEPRATVEDNEEIARLKELLAKQNLESTPKVEEK
jgi:non-homologous end joining protein Ku